MCTIAVTEDSITAARYGTSISLDYLLQETILLHSALDEITKAIFDVDDTVTEADRLIILVEDDNAIDRARKRLPARTLTELISSAITSKNNININPM